jgi:predicted GIY-YIG superfamily endonuclease/DNA-binding XRE family transcriptional regulator
MYYVYELVNQMGTVEYVGKTVNPKKRFRQHLSLPKGNHGRFHNRQDIQMNIVGCYENLYESLQVENDLQVYWGLETDRSKRSVKGIKNGCSKLTEEQVKEIKNLLTKKISQDKIAKEFNVSRSAIALIDRGKSWKHVV